MPAWRGNRLRGGAPPHASGGGGLPSPPTPLPIEPSAPLSPAFPPPFFNIFFWAFKIPHNFSDALSSNQCLQLHLSLGFVFCKYAPPFRLFSATGQQSHCERRRWRSTGLSASSECVVPCVTLTCILISSPAHG